MDLRKLSAFVLAIIFLGVLSFYYPELTGESPRYEYERERCFVRRVIDGDTVEADIGEIRLLGINTPEKSKPYYSEAKEFLRQIENKSVEILRDYEDEDKYGRKLRYVFYEGRILNVEILQEGLGTSFMADNLRYRNKLKAAEQFAMSNNAGLWEKSSEKCSNCIKLIELNPEKEFFIIKNSCDFSCDLSKWSVKDDANHFFNLENLGSGGEKRYDSKGSIWNNNQDRFFMRDDKGKLVLFYEY